MNMKPIRLLFAAALVLLGLAACDKEDAPVLTPETDITAGFDPDFAKRLQERGIIANATHITYADVADITELDISGEENDWEEGKGLTSLKGNEYCTSLTNAGMLLEPIDVIGPQPEHRPDRTVVRRKPTDGIGRK